MEKQDRVNPQSTQTNYQLASRPFFEPPAPATQLQSDAKNGTGTTNLLSIPAISSEGNSSNASAIQRDQSTNWISRLVSRVIQNKSRAIQRQVVVKTTSKILQKKFKHAADFGISGNYSKATADEFDKAIQKHVNKPGIQVITGTYRKDPVTHYFDPATDLNVIVSPGGEFISGWKLTAAQKTHVTTTGNLGGG